MNSCNSKSNLILGDSPKAVANLSTHGSKFGSLELSRKDSEFTFVSEYNDKDCSGLFSSTNVDDEP